MKIPQKIPPKILICHCADALTDGSDEVAKVQIDERPGFQNWFWGVQRFCWAALVVAIAAALAGLSGAGGPFSSVVSKGDVAVVSFPSIMRMNRAETLLIRGDAGSVSFDRDFLDVLDVGTITPTPSRQLAVAGGMVLIFEGAGEMSVTVSVTPKKVSRFTVGLRVGEEVHSWSTFVLP